MVGRGADFDLALVRDRVPVTGIVASVHVLCADYLRILEALAGLTVRSWSE
jgi:hypothetical protein